MSTRATLRLIKRLISEGLGRRKIAAQLCISEWEARSLIAQLQKELKIVDKTEKKPRPISKTGRPSASKSSKEVSGKPSVKLVDSGFPKSGDKPIDADIPRKVQKRDTSFKVAVLSDFHYPYQDDNAIALAKAVLRDEKPDVIVLAGDICDCYQASQFMKSPDREYTLQEEMDYARDKLAEWVEEFEYAEFKFLEGNHEERLIKYAKKNANALASIRAMHISSILELDKLNIEFIPGDKDLEIGNLTLMHGHLARKHAGVTARAHFEEYGCSVIVGHIHRLSTAWKRNKYGPHALIENGCCDRETEILTLEGWKYLPDIANDEVVYSLDPATRIAEWCKIDKKIQYKYTGKMLHFKNSHTDLLVTPDHRFIGNKQDHADTEFCAASKLPAGFSIPIASGWSGTSQEKFCLPKYTDSRGRLISKSVDIQMDIWASFLAIYIAEGWSSFKWGKTIIAQKENNREISDLLSKMPFRWTRIKDGWQCYSKQLSAYLSRLGKSYDKYVPSYIKELDKDTLEKFLHFIVLGDGSIDPNCGKIIYYTSSKDLSDDMQEIAIKLGYGTSIYFRQPREWHIRGSSGMSRLQYEVNMFSSDKKKFIGNIKPNKVEFDDDVFCVTVEPHNTILLRRNGKVAWSGNCLCDMDVEYVRFPDWQHGFTMLHYDGEDFSVTQYPVLNHKIITPTKVYSI